MTGGEVFAWLAKLAGGEAIKGQLGKRGLRAEVRMLRKALEDSQNHRAELERTAELLDRSERECERQFAEIVRLRAENVALRAELKRLRAKS